MKIPNSKSQEFQRKLSNLKVNSSKLNLHQKMPLLNNSFYPISGKRKIINPYKHYATKSLHDHFVQTHHQKMFYDKNNNNIVSKQQKKYYSQINQQINQHNQKRKNSCHDKQQNKKQQQQEQHVQINKILFNKLQNINKPSQFSSIKANIIINKQKDSIKSQAIKKNYLKDNIQKQNYNDKIVRKSAVYILSLIRKQKQDRKQRAQLVQKIADAKIQKDLIMQIRSTNLSPIKQSQIKKQSIKNKSLSKISKKKINLTKKLEITQFQNKIFWKNNEDKFKIYQQNNKPQIKNIVKKSYQNKQFSLLQNIQNQKKSCLKVTYFDLNEIDTQINYDFYHKNKFQNGKIDNIFQKMKLTPW